MGIDDAFVGEGIGVDWTKWSRNFNHLKHEYGEGEGFSVWVDNGTLPAGQTLLQRGVIRSFAARR